MNKNIILNATTALLITTSAVVNAGWELIAINETENSASWANDINDSGIIVGKIVNYPNLVEHPFMTGENGLGLKIFDIAGSAEGINNTGQVIGKSSAGAIFMTGPNGEGLTYLDYAREAYDINNLGQIVGLTKTGHGFITGANGIGMTDLGPITPRAVNDSGQVAGSFNIGGGSLISHAFITGPNGAGFTDLGAPDGSSSYAYDINNSGQVVGYYATKAAPGTSPYGFEDPRPFITDSNGTNIRILGTSGGAAFGINDHGQAVISTNILCDFCTPGDGFSFLADNDTITQINDFSPDGLYYFDAKSINNNGQIAGTGISVALQFSFSTWHAFMVSSDSTSPTPVPEPSTYAMLLAGLGLLFFRTKTELNS